MTCPVCGGEWFTEVEYHRYSASAGGYPSVELAHTEALPQITLECLCGWRRKPSQQMRSGPTPNAEIQSFAQSITLAAKHPHTPTPGQVAELHEKLRQVVEQVATRQEIHLANLAIASLRDQVDQPKHGLSIDAGRQAEAAPPPEEGPTRGKPSPGPAESQGTAS